MRGRKPKPTALKMFEGNPGKRALNQNEPTASVRWPHGQARPTAAGTVRPKARRCVNRLSCAPRFGLRVARAPGRPEQPDRPSS